MLIWVLQSSQCSKVCVAQHWGRKGAHLSENKGGKSEFKKFGEKSRKTASVSTICDEYCSCVTRLAVFSFEMPCIALENRNISLIIVERFVCLSFFFLSLLSFFALFQGEAGPAGLNGRNGEPGIPVSFPLIVFDIA